MNEAPSPLEAWRRRLGLSKYRIELDTKLARTTIYSAFKTGEANFPTLRSIADCFGIEVWELLRGPSGFRDQATEDVSETEKPQKLIDSALDRLNRCVVDRYGDDDSNYRRLAADLGETDKAGMLRVWRRLRGETQIDPFFLARVCSVLGIRTDYVLGLDHSRQDTDRGVVGVVSKTPLTRGVVGPQLDSLTLPAVHMERIDPGAKLLGVADHGVILVIDHRKLELQAGMELLIRIEETLGAADVRIARGGLMVAPRDSATLYDPADDQLEILGRILIRIEDVVVNALEPSAL